VKLKIIFSILFTTPTLTFPLPPIGDKKNNKTGQNHLETISEAFRRHIEGI
jgi:hypothetical protein